MTNIEVNILKAEILLKIKVTLRKVKKLQRETYPTEGPKYVLELSLRILNKIISLYDKYSYNQLFFIKGGIIKFIIKLISRIEYSTIKNVTWSIIPAYNMLFKALLSNTEYIIAPQWEENYGIINNNIIDNFKRYLSTPELIIISDSLENAEVEINEILDGIPKKIYLISYSRLEKLSALHLALLGHEIGHIFAEKWINEDYIKFSQDTKLSDLIMEYVENEIKKEKKDDDMFKENIIENKRLYYNRLITQNYQEILSDIFGCALFGQTYVVAMYIFASINGDINISKWEKGYLSWKFRLQNCIRFLSVISEDKPDLIKINDFYNNICDSIKGSIEDTNNELCLMMIESYKKKDKDIFNTICKYLNSGESKSVLFKDRINMEQIDAAYERLKYGIIPNAILVEDNENSDEVIEIPIDIINILYAIWIISYENNKEINILVKNIQHYNLLGIKGIELSVEQEKYNDFIKKCDKK